MQASTDRQASRPGVQQDPCFETETLVVHNIEFVAHPGDVIELAEWASPLL
jgi:hypothetical protein